MRKVEGPTKRQEAIGKCEPHDVYDHPAFGMISMGVRTGGDNVLFGSDIGHSQCITITIKSAELARNLSNDWYHGRQELIEVTLSHSQFAEFITNPNKGDGIPCTITHFEGKLIPAIERIETKQEMFRREIASAASGRIEKAMKEIERLSDLIESGKTPKSELRKIKDNIAREVGYLPGSISFVVEQAEEALEKATTAAKIEIEATINHHINRIGTDAARSMGILSMIREG